MVTENILRTALLIALIIASTMPSISGREKTAPAVTIPCASLKKLPNGNWLISGQVTIQIGEQRLIMADVEISPKGVMLGPIDVYDLIERECQKSI